MKLFGYLMIALALTACVKAPNEMTGKPFDVGTGPHMTTTHPAYAACGYRAPATYKDGKGVC